MEFCARPREWQRGKVLAVGAKSYRVQAEGMPNTYQVPLLQVRPAPPVKNRGETDITVGDYVEVIPGESSRSGPWLIGRVVEIQGDRYRVEYRGKYNSDWFVRADFRNLIQEQQQQNQQQAQQFYQELMPYWRVFATRMAQAQPQTVWSDPKQSFHSLAEFRAARAELEKAARLVLEKYPQIENPPPAQIGASLLSAPGNIRQMLIQRESVTDQFESELLVRQGKSWMDSRNQLMDSLTGQPLLIGDQKATWAPFLACDNTAPLVQAMEGNLAGYIR